jgi:hypothetical protein
LDNASNLVVVGGGDDPSLPSHRLRAPRAAPHAVTPLTALAGAIIAASVHGVAARCGRRPHSRLAAFLPAWKPITQQATSARLSALTVGGGQPDTRDKHRRPTQR